MGSNNEIALNHGYEDSFNQSLQNALFNLSKTGQRDQSSTTHLSNSRQNISFNVSQLYQMKAGLSSGSDISEDGNDEDETSPQDLSVPVRSFQHECPLAVHLVILS